MVIMKFGGTSVEDASAIRRVAGIVRSRRKRNPVVVVSAMAKITDQLAAMGQKAASGDCDSSLALLPSIRERHIAAANDLLGKKSSAVAKQIHALVAELENFLRGIAAVKELSARSNDYLLSFGELLSSQVVAAAFPALGLDAEWVDSRKCLVTNGNHTRALPIMDETRKRSQVKIASICKDGRIPVMGGFIASTLEGITTTLGRGGSDYSAAIVGAALDAASIEIWTDVEGMMTTDPRICPNARTIPRISFNEAAELAYFGAKVLHPATLLPAIHKNIPVYVLNSRNIKSKGTRITEHAPSNGAMFRAITAKTGVSIVNVVASRGVMVHGFLRSVFEALDLHGSSVDIVAISEVSMSFTMDTKRLPKALIADLEKIAEVNCDDQQAIVCLVGEDIHGVPGIAASVFNTIAKAGVNIRMISQGASELNISFVIKESDVPQAVRHLHARFFENHMPGASFLRAVKPSTNGRKFKLNSTKQTRSASVRRNSVAKTAASSKHF
ncbi:MAG TPA: lysine-sensitive aspartokinase 3 [Terriglobales bacterium]|nr:lysine-sensitive aspartokinase 3 [Terriglobales bacterium]